jgi:hypothetical protein
VLAYPPIDNHNDSKDDPDAKPFEIQFVPKAKAWSNFPSTQPITVTIPRNKAKMHERLRDEIDAAYMLGSWFMVDGLAAGAFGKEQYFSLRLANTRGAGAGNAMMQELRENVSEDRRELFTMFDKVRDELIHKEARGLTLLQSSALCHALNEELPRCEAAAIAEAARYLSLDKRDEQTIRENLSYDRAPHLQALTGPEGRALVRALESLSGPYSRQQAAQRAYEATLPIKDAQKGMVWMSLGVMGMPMMIANNVEAYRKLTGPKTAREAALKQLAEATADFQSKFAELAIQYPILFKIADCADKDEVEWTQRTVIALQEALTASADLAKALSEDSSKVWRFPGLIDRSIRKGFGAETGFISRVASDKLMKENGMPPFARLNAGIQLFNTTLMFVPFPPVKVGVVIASLLGDAAELLESYFRTKEQKMGFRAAIDPANALGADASYVSTVIQAGFLALDLLPIRGAVREFAAETAEGAKAARMREAALQLAH